MKIFFGSNLGVRGLDIQRALGADQWETRPYKLNMDWVNILYVYHRDIDGEFLGRIPVWWAKYPRLRVIAVYEGPPPIISPLFAGCVDLSRLEV